MLLLFQPPDATLTLTSRRYVPFDPDEPVSKSRFAIGIADKASVEGLILNARRGGVGGDTSWRHKSDTRAAMTVLITVNEWEHLVPGMFHHDECQGLFHC